jgi:hypothetical protein
MTLYQAVSNWLFKFVKAYDGISWIVTLVSLAALVIAYLKYC